MKTRTIRRQQNRGSALAIVIMFSLALMLISGAIVSWSLNERRINTRNAAWLEARNAAEAVAEYGCYQVAQAFNTRLSPTFSATGTNPVSFPSSLATTYFGNSHIDTSSIVLTVGNVTNVPATGYNYVDPNDPNNKYDPLVGRYVSRRDVTIVAKASATPATGGAPVTAYVEEKVSIRGAPLLAYAVFYSGNDLEFNETPQMDIWGAVHVNGNLFVGPAGSSPEKLSFHGPVTASGNVFHAWRGTTSTAKEGGSAMSSTTPVYFSTDGVGAKSSTLVDMRSNGVWKDSTMGASSSVSGVNSLTKMLDPSQDSKAATRNAQFSQYASQTWKGNLQTAAMGIQSYNPMGFTEVVGHTSTLGDIYATDPAADYGPNVNTTGGYASSSGYGNGYGPHALIEPPLNPSTTDTYYNAKESIENSKFSRKAGLYLQVSVNSSNVATMTLYGDPNSAPSGTPSSKIGPNGGLKLGTVPANVVQYIPYTTSGGNVTAGLYDQHQDKGQNLVQIDMGALKTALTDMAVAGTGTANVDIVDTSGNKWGIGTATTGYDPNNPSSTGWNGGVYVEVKNASTYQTSVLLGNAVVSKGSSLAPKKDSAPNQVDGVTIATNAPVYILGSFNADGVVEDSSKTYTSAQFPDDHTTAANANSSAEVPMAIAADSVTVLSDKFFGTSNHLAPSSGNSGSAYTSTSSTVPTASGDVEIAAAMITGTITTSPTSSGSQQYSGGIHNLPRFLENWSKNDNTVAIRGSLVSMFNSRVADKGWSISYYSAPTRLWGYDQLYAGGRYPPIVPAVISYRRVDFTYLKNATEYNTELGNL